MYPGKHILRMIHSAGGYAKRLHGYAKAVNIYTGDNYMLFQNGNVYMLK